MTDGVLYYRLKNDFGNHFHCHFHIHFALRDICFWFVSYRFDFIDLIVVVVVLCKELILYQPTSILNKLYLNKQTRTSASASTDGDSVAEMF